MKITRLIEVKPVTVVNDLDAGEVFIFLSGDFQGNPFLMTNMDYIVNLIDGFCINVNDCYDLPV